MKIFARAYQWPPRLAAGAYILNSGLSKAQADRDTAIGVHGMAATAFPFLGEHDPETFVGLFSKAEIAVGAALLLPTVPSLVAGAALTAFAGGLLGFYLKMPGLREEGSLRPSQQGIGIAKDIWLLGIGLGLVLDELTQRSR
ncbi:hypothetical protein [Nonomuraea guangzhouensis]|uniref:DoxX family membrane protein n=1 Tax=Nonomuraea guangzhouensis TaxID=1291555 RepID=A0ABW4GR48_9ACTN|nr:hypothetical protein [Nonomuraea guangzhouensis]